MLLLLDVVACFFLICGVEIIRRELVAMFRWVLNMTLPLA